MEPGSVATVAGEIPLDPQRVAQVLGNLLDNAPRPTPAGGTVALVLRQPDPGPEMASGSPYGFHSSGSEGTNEGTALSAD
jgi:hypothetical protein